MTVMLPGASSGLRLVAKVVRHTEGGGFAARFSELRDGSPTGRGPARPLQLGPSRPCTRINLIRLGAHQIDAFRASGSFTRVSEVPGGTSTFRDHDSTTSSRLRGWRPIGYDMPRALRSSFLEAC